MTDQPLRFCMITTFYPPYNFGGDGIFVHRLANELASRGHQVEVIHCLDSYRLLARGKPVTHYPNHPGVKVHGLKSPLGPISPLATQQTGFPLFKISTIREILSHEFDVIHYHNISLVGGPKILTYGRGVKLYTLHEQWLVCPTHTLFKFNREVCSQRSCFLCSLTYRRPPQWWRWSNLLKTSLKHVDAFIALNRTTQIKHREMGLDLPMIVLPPCMPGRHCNREDAEGLAAETKDRYFLFVGRLEKLKGLQTLIPIFYQYQNASLRVVGVGSYERQLRKMASGSTNIRFLGYRPQEEIAKLYRGALAVIVPSIGLEMVPQVILEAFSEATPVLIRNSGGLAELVEQTGAGMVYSTEEELHSALDRLSMAPQFGRELGRRGFQVITEKWTTESHIRSYLELIHEIRSRG